MCGTAGPLHFSIVFECGAIVNPDGLNNQVEGSVVQGLGGALFEAFQFPVTVPNRMVVSERPAVGPLAQAGRPARIIALALAAGVAFGLFYVLLAPIEAGAGLWPLLGIRAGSLVAAIAVLVPAFRSMRLARSSLPWAAGAGTLDIAANALYLAAAYHGALSVVGPIASLYPAGTVLLAVVVDRERLRPMQSIALGLAAVALVLTHLG